VSARALQRKYAEMRGVVRRRPRCAQRAGGAGLGGSPRRSGRCRRRPGTADPSARTPWLVGCLGFGDGADWRLETIEFGGDGEGGDVVAWGLGNFSRSPLGLGRARRQKQAGAGAHDGGRGGHEDTWEVVSMARRRKWRRRGTTILKFAGGRDRLTEAVYTPLLIVSRDFCICTIVIKAITTFLPFKRKDIRRGDTLLIYKHALIIYQHICISCISFHFLL
jgi:hypothetical protein